MTDETEEDTALVDLRRALGVAYANGDLTISERDDAERYLEDAKARATLDLEARERVVAAARETVHVLNQRIADLAGLVLATVREVPDVRLRRRTLEVLDTLHPATLKALEKADREELAK